jgi:predicted DNA-binding protein with PD1-like motif
MKPCKVFSSPLLLLPALLAVFALSPAALAQQTQRDIVNPAKNPADDAKPNNPAVPDVYAITGHFDHIVVLRFKFKANLLAGLEKMVAEQHIKNGVILSGIGSVRGYEVHSVSNRDFPSHDTFTKDPTQPADIVSMNGYVIDGHLHPHITLATPNKVIAGHLEPGTEVFTFAIVTIGVINDADLSRADDKTYR